MLELERDREDPECYPLTTTCIVHTCGHASVYIHTHQVHRHITYTHTVWKVP